MQKLGQKRIDSADLHTGAAANIPQLRGADVILAIRHK